MQRASVKELEAKTRLLGAYLGMRLHLSAWSPGDRDGTRFYVHQRDTDGTIGVSITARVRGSRAASDTIESAITALAVFSRSLPEKEREALAARLRAHWEQEHARD